MSLSAREEALARGVRRAVVESLESRDARLDRVDGTLDGLREALTVTQARVADVEGALADVDRVVAAVEELRGAVAGLGVDAITTRVSAVVARLDALESELATMVGAAVNREMEAARREVTNEWRALRESIQTVTVRALERAASVRDGEPGPQGAPGEPGARGAPGGLSEVVPYVPGEIYREGAHVLLEPGRPDNWAVARAVRETYNVPGDPDAEDWVPVLFHGMEGPGFAWRGLHRRGEQYNTGDVVISDAGALWVRKQPGTSDGIPGPAWDLMVKRGKTGGRGERGERGERGDAGRDGVGIRSIDVEGGHFVITMTDDTTHLCEVPARFIPVEAPTP